MQASEDPLRILRKQIDHLEVPELGQHYDLIPPELFEFFQGVDYKYTGSLKFSGNSYGPNVLAWLCKHVVQNCKNLSILDISHIFVERTEKEVTKSIVAITKVIEPMNLHELNLSDNTLSQKSIQVVCKYLKTNESIKILNFNNCALGTTGMAILAKTLKYDRKAAAKKAI